MRASRKKDAGEGSLQAGARCDTPCLNGAEVTRPDGVMKPPPALASLAQIFRALGDPTRVSIAWALSHRELCVCDLAALLGLSQSVVSHSLRTLRDLRLVRHRKEGRVVFYALDDVHVARLLRVGMDHVEEAA